MWFDHELFRVVRAAAAAEDREWFEARPDATSRLRPYVPGEGDSADSFFVVPPEHLIVRAERDGTRTFLILHPIGMDPDAEAGPSSAYWFDDDDDEDSEESDAA